MTVNRYTFVTQINEAGLQCSSSECEDPRQLCEKVIPAFPIRTRSDDIPNVTLHGSPGSTSLAPSCRMRSENTLLDCVVRKCLVTFEKSL